MIINEFRAALENYFPSGYYADEAPDTATYPYRVSSFGGSFDEENSTIAALEIDYWTSGKSYAAIYDMAEEDIGDGNTANPTGLNKRRFELTSGTVFLMLDTPPFPITDPDKDLRRVRVSYSAKFFRRA